MRKLAWPVFLSVFVFATGRRAYATDSLYSRNLSCPRFQHSASAKYASPGTEDGVDLDRTCDCFAEVLFRHRQKSLLRSFSVVLLERKADPTIGFADSKRVADFCSMLSANRPFRIVRKIGMM
jgi:hypothetical protein